MKKSRESIKMYTLFIIPTIFVSMGVLSPSAAFAVDTNIQLSDVEANKNSFGLDFVASDSSVAKMMKMKNMDERRQYAQSFDRQFLITKNSQESVIELPEFEVVEIKPIIPDDKDVESDGTVKDGARKGNIEGASSTEGIEIFDYPDSRFDVNASVRLAYSEVGTSRPTGWSAAGECIMSAKRWINAGGGSWHGGGAPLDNYANATEVSIQEARPGDIVQYIYSASPGSWVSGIHTVMITGVNNDGTFKIVESNNPGGSGLVTSNDRWLPKPPNGFESRFFRF